MRRGGSAGDKTADLRRRKAASRKRPVVAKPKPGRGLAKAGLQKQLERKTKELNEALERQTATAEVLRVISSSPGDLRPVFDTILANAMRLCQAQFGNLLLCDGDRFRLVAGHAPRAYTKFWQPGVKPGPNNALGRLLRNKQVVHIPDAAAERAYAERDPLRVATIEFLQARTFLVVPMLKESEIVGAFTIYRQEVRPFTDKQIELVKSFAAQAVIAIENTRLLNELRQSLEQQTATADVLRVISSSPGELEPVFQAMLENATRICHAKFGILMLRDSDGFRSVSVHGAPAAYAEAMAQNPHIPPRPGSGLVTLAQIKQPVQLADLQTEPAYQGNRLATLAGARTLLMVPMMKDDELVGALNFYRQEVRLFTDKQIALVENFAAQAV